MKDAELKEKINVAFSHAVPDQLDSILSDCKEAKNTVVMMPITQKRRSWQRYVMNIAACLVLAFGCIFGVQTYTSNFAVASTVSLDVNPSIQITVNQKERVLDVVPLNEDGRIVVGEMDFSGSNIDVTVNALIGSMLKNGYLNDLANSILITVDGSGSAQDTALQDRLAQEVNALLQTDGFSGAVLSQTISDDSSLQALADQYGITIGKAQLIQSILTTNTQANTQHTFADLAPLSINELNLILTSNTLTLDSVSSLGSASEKAYIGQENALAAALAHAGFTMENLTSYEVDMDTEDGIFVYEIEFMDNGYEYEYDIDASTGAVVKYSREKDDEAIPSTSSGYNQTQNADLISLESAKEIALAHAGLSSSAVTFVKMELDEDDGINVYELEFVSGEYEYEYEINAETSAIMDYSLEHEDDD